MLYGSTGPEPGIAFSVLVGDEGAGCGDADVPSTLLPIEDGRPYSTYFAIANVRHMCKFWEQVEELIKKAEGGRPYTIYNGKVSYKLLFTLLPTVKGDKKKDKRRQRWKNKKNQI